MDDQEVQVTPEPVSNNDAVLLSKIEEMIKTHTSQIGQLQEEITKYRDMVRTKLQKLFSLKIDPENENGSLITDEEYREMRQKLLIEQEDLRQELAKTDNLTNDWMDVAVRVFNFAAKALEKWKNGTIEEKRIILHAIGLSLVLKDKKLEITPRSMFREIQKATSLASGSTIKGCVHGVGVEPT